MKRLLPAALVLAALGLSPRAEAQQDPFDWAESAPGYWVPAQGPSYIYAPPPPPPGPVYSPPGIYIHFGFHGR